MSDTFEKPKTMEEDRIGPIYKGRHVLLTGGKSRKLIIESNCSWELNVDDANAWILGTGFMGKVFVEKLLRMTDVGQIYMLMRVKKGKNPKERLVDTFNNPVSKENFIKFLESFLEHLNDTQVTN